MSRWDGQDHLCAMQMTGDTGCQIFIAPLGFFIALQTSFWRSPSYPLGAISWYGMCLCCRNLLTSGSINLGPSCFLSFFVYLTFLLLHVFSECQCAFAVHVSGLLLCWAKRHRNHVCDTLRSPHHPPGAGSFADESSLL